MGETDYNALLYDKMKAEQDKYKDWLLSQPPEEILNHTYEYTMREDIVMCMEELELSPKQAKALLRSPCPLDESTRSLRTEKSSIWIPFGIPLKQGQTMYSNGIKTEKAGEKNGVQIKNRPCGYAGVAVPA